MSQDEPRSPEAGTANPVVSILNRSEFLRAGFFTVNALTGLILTGVATRFLVGDSLKTPANQWAAIGPATDFAPGKVHEIKYNLRADDLWREVQLLGLVYVQTEDGASFTALDATCTHLGCNVRWQPDRSEFACPCHNGHFNRLGDVISGPPPGPLKKLLTKVEDGVLFVRI